MLAPKINADFSPAHVNTYVGIDVFLVLFWGWEGGGGLPEEDETVIRPI